MYKYTWYCRWDGKTYKPTQETDRDGFCSCSCKQAHYRAYKKYVTTKTSKTLLDIGRPVTQKKRKKRK